MKLITASLNTVFTVFIVSLIYCFYRFFIRWQKKTPAMKLGLFDCRLVRRDAIGAGHALPDQ